MGKQNNLFLHVIQSLMYLLCVTSYFSPLESKTDLMFCLFGFLIWKSYHIL